MISPVHPAFAWRSPAKAVLTLAFLVSQMPAQAAAPAQPAPPGPASPASAPASAAQGKIPHKHRAIKRGPVKPDTYPTQPQQQVNTLR